MDKRDNKIKIKETIDGTILVIKGNKILDEFDSEEKENNIYFRTEKSKVINEIMQERMAKMRSYETFEPNASIVCVKETNEASGIITAITGGFISRYYADDFKIEHGKLKIYDNDRIVAIYKADRVDRVWYEDSVAEPIHDLEEESEEE